MESPPDRLRLRGFDALYGLQVDAFGDGLVRAHVPVRDEIRQPFGLVHGGVLATIAESLASLGTLHGSPADHVPLGMSNHTTFLRPIADGTVHATATALHRGRTTWVWDVEMSDDDGRRCAVTRMTIAVRPRRDGAGAGPDSDSAADQPR
ncbi:MAG: PaaI family thioesterase [Actinomycetota bacterium]|nr:PaaI family thioesterase [Actinomycetota bacterium]